MGHYLSTTNPEAAERAQMPPVMRSGLPKVGKSVRYYPRKGEARGGVTDFAMYVTSVNELRGTVSGVLILEANDLRDVLNAPYKTEGETFGWGWIEDDQAPQSSPVGSGGDLSDLQMLTRQMTETMAAQAETILALQEQIHDLEVRLDVIEDQPQSARKRKTASPE